MVAILANGAFPESESVLRRLKSSARIICCDGAAATALSVGLEIYAAVGDGDSLSAEVKSRLGGKWRHVTEQDTNDLSKAFRLAVGEGAREIEIYGASGKREDHLLANVFHLVDFNFGDIKTDMVTDHGRFTVVKSGEKRMFDAPIGTAVSIFAPAQGTEVRSSGLKWPLDGVSLESLWRGTLNSTCSDSFEIEATKPVIVFISSKSSAAK